MHRLLVEEGAPGGPVAVDRPPVDAERNWTVMGAYQKVVARSQQHDRIRRVAQHAGALRDRGQDRRDVRRRSSDHPEDVAAGVLLLERLAELAGALLDLGLE